MQTEFQNQSKGVLLMKRTAQITITALFAALTAVFSQISFPVPFTPIVFTMGVMAVYLTAALLPKWYALLAQIVYLLLGAIGLPVYSGFHGGIGTLLGPTGGYLMAYPIMALLGAWLRELLEKTPLPRLIQYLIALLATLIPCYLLGSLWYMQVGQVGWMASLSLTALPFIPMDAVKVVFSALLAVPVHAAVRKSGFAASRT